MPPDAVVARLAATQAGNVTRAQLHGVGLTDARIATQVRDRVLIRRFRGVYALGHVPQGRLSFAFAAWLAYGPAAALSHRDAAALLGALPEPVGPVHLSRPSGGRSRRGTVLHTADVAGDLWHRHGLSVTSPARTLLDLAATEPRDVVERAWNEAQVQRLITPTQLDAGLRRWAGRRGTSVLTGFLDDLGISRSVLEDRFRSLVRREGLPEPELNVWVEGVLVDALWRDQRVVVELDGRAVHDAGRAFEGDRRKANVLQLAGWVVLRFTYRRIREEPASVVGEVLAALAR